MKVHWDRRRFQQVWITICSLIHRKVNSLNSFNSLDLLTIRRKGVFNSLDLSTIHNPNTRNHLHNFSSKAAKADFRVDFRADLSSEVPQHVPIVTTIAVSWRIRWNAAKLAVGCGKIVLSLVEDAKFSFYNNFIANIN